MNDTSETSGRAVPGTEAGTTQDATRTLGRFVAGIRYDDLPVPVRERAKLAILDWAGSTLSGTGSASASQVAALLDDLGGPGESTVVGRQGRYPALHASMLNGVQGAVHEVDDVHIDCRIHPGLSVVSAAFALAEREHADGRRLIEAVVAGYEVVVRVAVHLGVLHNRWWHATGTAGAIGAAAAAAKVLGLDAAQCTGAIGLGATQGAGLIEGTEGKALGAKHFHGGKAAQNGIWAALLAKRGFLGSATALEGEFGFLAAFARRRSTGPLIDRDALLDRLGDDWYILRTISKPFACCLSSHAGIHALLALVREYDIRPQDVVSIEAFTNPGSYYMIRNPDPRDILQAKFSLPFALGAAVVRRDVSYRAFDDATLWDPLVRSVMARVSLETREEIGMIETRLRVRLADGRLVEGIGLRRSLEATEVMEKYRGLVSGIVEPGHAEAIIAAIESLESATDVRAVGDVLAARN